MRTAPTQAAVSVVVLAAEVALKVGVLFVGTASYPQQMVRNKLLTVCVVSKMVEVLLITF